MRYEYRIIVFYMMQMRDILAIAKFVLLLIQARL